jgi:hypothetical protein
MLRGVLFENEYRSKREKADRQHFGIIDRPDMGTRGNIAYLFWQRAQPGVQKANHP